MAKGKAGWFASFMQGLLRPRQGSARVADSAGAIDGAAAAQPPESTTGAAGLLSASGAIEPVQAAGLGTTSAGAAATPLAQPTPAVGAATDSSPVEPPPLEDPAGETFLGEDAGALTSATGAVEPAVTGLELPGDPALQAATPAPKRPKKAGAKGEGASNRGKAKGAALTGDTAELVAAGGSETPTKPARKRTAKAQGDAEGLSREKAARKAAKAAAAAAGGAKPRKTSPSSDTRAAAAEGEAKPKAPRKRAPPKSSSESA